MFGSRRKVIARGERVYIFAPTRDTASDFIAFTVANKAYHQPWVFPATDKDTYRGYLERVDGKRAFGFLIARNEDEALVGVINVNDVLMGGQRCGSLGYYGTRAHGGQGYMREGLSLVLDHTFGPLGLHRIEANVQPDNDASLGLIARLGFRREGFSPSFLEIDGVWRDHERWAISEDEWRACRAIPRRAVSRVV